MYPYHVQFNAGARHIETTEHDISTLTAVLRNLSDGIIVIDRRGRFTLINPEAERILGFETGGRMPDSILDLDACYRPDTVTRYSADQLPLARALRGEEVSGEVIYIRPNGSSPGKWISTTSKSLRDNGDVIWGSMVMIKDITGSMQTEEHLSSMSSRFMTMVENQQAGILIENEKREIMQVNQMFCDLFGIQVPPEKMIGMDCSASAEQSKHMFADPDGFIDRIGQLIGGKMLVASEEVRLADGRVFERDYIPVFAGGQYRGHVWQYRDMTERREIRGKIKGFERLCMALEQTADSILITDRRGVIEYVNAAFEATTGYSREEALGNTPRILKSGKHDESFYRRLWGELTAGRPFRETVINRRKNGDLYWVQQTITPVKNDAGEITHFVSVLKDITDLLRQKEHEANLRLAREVQQRFYRAKGSLPGFDIAGAAYPAEETGGDYFDFIPMPNGCLGVVIGDASGHGVSSALVMAETRAYVRSHILTSHDAGKILTHINRALSADLGEGRFVTLMLCCVDPERRTMVYAGAGHEPGYVLDGNGRVAHCLENAGPPMGLIGDYTYTSSEISLRDKGSIVMLITDGVTETMAPDQTLFEPELAVAYVASHRRQPAAQIIRGLYQAARVHAAGQPQCDDITSVILKVL